MITEMICSLAAGIEARSGYQMQAEEQADVQESLNESNLMIVNEWENPEIEQKMEQMEHNIKKLLGIREKEIFESRYMLIQHLEKMQNRFFNGNIGTNYYNADIICRYPLEVYLVCRFVPDLFGVDVTKECSLLSLFLVKGLEKYKTRLSLLLVGNQEASVMNRTKEIVEDYIGTEISFMEIMPVYLYEHFHNLKREFDILLTTEREFVFLDQEFLRIHTLPEEREMEHLAEIVKEKAVAQKEKKKEYIRDQYFEQISEDDERMPELSEWIAGKSREKNCSLFTIGADGLFICEISPEETTRIRQHKLKSTITYQNKKVRMIVQADFHAGDEDVFTFFEVVSDILREMK